MFTRKIISDLGVELYDMIQWPPKGSNLFRKIPIFVRAYTKYDEFALIGRAILRIKDSS